MDNMLKRFMNREICVRVKTQEEFKKLMEYLEKETDLVWVNNSNKPTTKEFNIEELTFILGSEKYLYLADSEFITEQGKEIVEANIFLENFANPIKEVGLVSELDTPTQHELIKELYDKNYETYLAKNRKYGNSFQDTFRELGKISALTRMSDKFNRIKTMMLSDEVDDLESVEDDLLDLANYAIMTVYELNKMKGNKVGHE